MENVFWLSPHLPKFSPKFRRVLKYRTMKFCFIVIKERKLLSSAAICITEFISTMPISNKSCHIIILIRIGVAGLKNAKY
jgi:hypothetical protein